MSTRAHEARRRQLLKQLLALSVAGLSKHTLAAPAPFSPTDSQLRPVSRGKTEYDYIVIGSGAGGAPVAANLAEAGYEVLVLEAGNINADPNTYSIPAFNLAASADPLMNWNFYVKHFSDTSINGRGDNWVEDKQGILYPRASTIGGCTAHHVMLALLPENKDWDDIAQLTHDESWGSYNMRSFYAAVRRWLPMEMTPPSLLLKDPVIARLVAAAAIQSGTLKRAGMSRPNFNDGSILGADLLDPNDFAHLDNLREGLYGIPQSTLHGVRAGTRERLFQVMSEHPDKLFIQINALASRIVLSPPDAGKIRASGVEFIDRSHLYSADPLKRTITPEDQQKLSRKVTARREVILAGGAFNSPQLLMLSGIGAAAHLQQHHIPLKLDLPGVGENLQDRNELSVVTEFEKPLDIVKNCTFGQTGDPCLEEYRSNKLNRTYASNGLIAGIKKRYSKGSTHPELFIFGSPSRFDGYKPGFYPRGIEKPNYFTWAILRGYNYQNTGYVKLRSANPTDTPEINFRFFNDGAGGQADLDALIEGIQFAREINAKARKFGWMDQNRDREIFPGPTVQTYQQLSAAVKKGAWGHHASCSNKMGLESDRMAVVNPQGLVFGTANLRIVDASVFPRIPGLFIVLPLYMLAEKISVDILSRANNS